MDDLLLEEDLERSLDLMLLLLEPLLADGEREGDLLCLFSGRDRRGSLGDTLRDLGLGDR